MRNFAYDLLSFVVMTTFISTAVVWIGQVF